MILVETQNEDEAEFVKIIKKKNEKTAVTEGKTYEIKRKYYDNHMVQFLNGEAYIVNDVGREFFGVFNTCKFIMYKTKK